MSKKEVADNAEQRFGKAADALNYWIKYAPVPTTSGEWRATYYRLSAEVIEAFRQLSQVGQHRSARGDGGETLRKLCLEKKGENRSKD